MFAHFLQFKLVLTILRIVTQVVRMGGGCRGEVTIDIRPEFETQAATVQRLNAENNERKSEIRKLTGTIENLDKSVKMA